MSTPALPDVIDSSSVKRMLLFSLAVFLAVAIGPFLFWRGLSQWLFSSEFLPHMYCYLRRPGMVWTHVIADSGIALAYLVISITLAYLVYRARRDIPFHWMFLAFGLFIVACGGTHLIEVITIWKPVYVLAAVVKVFTATVSLATAVSLPATIPRVLTLVQQAKATQEMTTQLRASEARKEVLLRELQEGKETFERFFDSAPDAILVTDNQGHITDWNQQAQRMFGYDRSEVIGQPIEILVPEPRRQHHRTQRDSFMSAPKLRPMGEGLELYARRKDGTQAPVDITLSPLQFGGELRIMAAVRDMSEHKIAEEKLKDSIREKEVLLREVHHRVKNNLAVICSLLYLESTYAADEHAARVFRESENRVHSMALVHETLYGSKNLARIDFAEYANALANDILSSYGNPSDNKSPVQLKSDLDPVIMSIDLAVPCGLVLNELISNAFKHGFPGGKAGEIKITLRAEDDGNCVLRVDDTGAGIPADLDMTNNKSLGLRLVRSLTKQIRGTFALERRELVTSARVIFPVNDHQGH